jgi:Zn-dependent protease with chaperone function
VTLSYSLRLLSICLTSFFLLHMVAGAAVCCALRPANRFLERLPPCPAARRLLLMRVLPVAVALVSVLGICTPSYLRFEENMLGEQVGPVCLALASLGALVWVVALGHGLQAAIFSVRFTRLCRRGGRAVHCNGEPWPMLVIEDARPFLAQSGIFHADFVISQGLLKELSREELAAALRHESAHWSSRDNFQRLLLAFLPDIFPFWPAFESLERSWAQLKERAADDYVAAAGEGPAAALAAALVRLARMGRAPSGWTALPTSPLAGGDDLEGRVERLLAPARATPAAPLRGLRTLLGAAGLLATAGLAAAVWPTTLSPVHELLEWLLH